MIVIRQDVEQAELRRSNAIAWWVAALMAVAAVVALGFLVREKGGGRIAPIAPDRVAADQTLVSATSLAQSAADSATRAAQHAAENSARATHAAAEIAATSSAQVAQAAAAEVQNPGPAEGAPVQ
jgi:hypothetical protein